MICLAVPVQAGAASPWTGSWIWDTTPREHVYFRKTIDAGPDVSSAKLAITADNIYTVWVNGQEVGDDADWTSVDVYDITAHIKQGPNVVAVRATDPGAGTGGLLAEGAVTYADGSAAVFGTDRTWRMSLDDPPGWTSIDFDDAHWAAPVEIGKPPIGPWGGLEHPSLAPKTRMETVEVYWPKVTNPGDTLKVICKVKPQKRIPVDSPVCLRLLSRGQTVYEQWIEPDVPITKWEPGKIRTVTFAEYRLPVYIPRGRMHAQVVSNTTEGTVARAIWVGPRPTPSAPRLPVSISNLRVVAEDSGGSTVLRVDANVANTDKSDLFMLALMKGDEMWHATDLAGLSNALITLPKSFPGGTYTARVFQHKSSGDTANECQVTVPGPDVTSRRPLGYGVFRDCHGVRHRWYINPHGALIWDGAPYVPVGAMYLSRFFMDFSVADVAHNEETYREDVGRLKQIRAAGVTDLYLNPCKNWAERPAWVWQRFADMCEEAGINYGLQVSNHVQPLKGYHIAQDEYVVAVKGGETARARITGTYFGKIGPGNAVLYAAFDPATAELLDWGAAEVSSDGTAVEVRATPRAEPGAGINVHFVPEYVFSGDMHDYWQGINDTYRAELDRFFGALDLGPGFRLWIDPLDNEQSFRDMNRMLPHSARFRAMFAEWLRGKYQTPGACAAAWSISGNDAISGFDQLARLVPLGKPSAASDLGYVLDETARRTFAVDLAKSAMWFDMLRFRDSSIAEFNNRVAEMIKKHHDAPVVLKATDTDCFTNLRAHGGFDGVGMEAYGAAPELTRGCGGGVYARCKMANRTMWTLVTETGLAAPDVPIGYPDPLRMVKELGSMVEMNAKGTFYFLLAAGGGRPGEGWYIFNLTEDPRQIHWMGAFSRMMKSAPLLADYEPEVDYYYPGSIAGQHSGFARAKPAFLSDIPSQSVAGESGRWVVPASTRVPADARRLIVNLENSPATESYGQEFEQALATREVVVVGHRRNLGALPIDHYYTDRFVKDADGSLVQVLKPSSSAEVFARTADGEAYGLTDGSLTLYTKPDWLSSVRKMAGRAPQTGFLRDVLGLEELDLGRAFQGMRFGAFVYLWNLTDSDHSLTLDVPAAASPDSPRVRVTQADGGKLSPLPGESIRILLPARAGKPVVLENMIDPEAITGIDTANLAAAMREWTDVQERAKRAGLESAVVPPSGDWRKVYVLADELRKKVDDALRTTYAARVTGVSVDGDLVEWSGVSPLRLKVDVGKDFSTISDYDGARFYLGYDEGVLYVAGDVVDDAIVNNYSGDRLWNGDAVEVFVDLKPDVNPLSHNYTSDCFQFIFAPTSVDGRPAMAVKSPGMPPDHVANHTQFAVRKTDSGWTFEAAIARAEINDYVPRPGGAIGFNIQLDDSDGGDRISEKLWRGDKDASRNRLSLGRLVFGE